MFADKDRPGVAEKTEKAEGGLWENVKVIIQALLLAVVIRTVLFQPFTIPSGSMMPTLLVGDYLFVNKFSYGYSKYSLPFSPNLFSGRIFASEPERGDIVVFRFPPNPDIDYIKRVIGLPGDEDRPLGDILDDLAERAERAVRGLKGEALDDELVVEQAVSRALKKASQQIWDRRPIVETVILRL